jgi:type III pantothenate kinase
LNTLLVDAGNTRIKFGLADHTGFTRYIGACSTLSSMQTILSFLTKQSVTWERALGVCAAGNHVRAQLDELFKQTNVAVQWLSGHSPLAGLRNDYATPQTLGADRWLAAYGVVKQPETTMRPCVLATFGTATTVDLIEWDNTQNCHVFVGGIILVGLAAAWRSVSQHTANLPDVSHLASELRATGSIPNSTQTALQLGAIYAQVGAVQHLVSQVTRRGAAPKLLLAGGDASFIEPYLDNAKTIAYPIFLGLAHASIQPHNA